MLNDKILIAKWTSLKNITYVELYKYNDGTGYSYITNNGGGNLGQVLSDTHAIELMKNKLEYFAPNGDIKKLIRRI